MFSTGYRKTRPFLEVSNSSVFTRQHNSDTANLVSSSTVASSNMETHFRAVSYMASTIERFYARKEAFRIYHGSPSVLVNHNTSETEWLILLV
ncbi:hypothetical protein WAI453_007775 [Rhynchosporium graminicola]